MSYKQQLLENSQDVEVLIVGNSHTFIGLNPSELSFKSINIANDSRKIETDYFLLKRNIKRLKKLKAIVLPISFYTFFIDELSISEKRLYYHFYKLIEYDQGWFQNRLIGNVSIAEHLNNSFFAYKGAENISFLGQKKTVNTYSFQPELIKHRIGNSLSRISNEKAIQKNVKYLDKIISICRENKIRLFLLRPPYHPDFYKYGGEIYSITINNILLEYKGTEVIKVIDARIFNITDDKYFKDIDHLNDLGASFLTKKTDSIIQL